MPVPKTYISCLIRIRCMPVKKDARPAKRMQIQVDDIQSGQKHQFDTLDELFLYLERRISLLGPAFSESQQ